jgi:hypothetical protein
MFATPCGERIAASGGMGKNFDALGIQRIRAESYAAIGSNMAELGR